MKELSKKDYNDMLNQINESNVDSIELFREIIDKKIYENNILIAKCNFGDLYEYCIRYNSNKTKELFNQLNNMVKVGTYNNLQEAINNNRDQIDKLSRLTNFVYYVKTTNLKGVAHI